MRAIRIWFALSLVVAALGCGRERECREGTVFLTVDLGEPGRADSLLIEVGTGEPKPGKQIGPINVGAQETRATVEIVFHEYARLKTLDFTVRAMKGQTVVGLEQSHVGELPPQCLAWSMSLSAQGGSNAGGDAAAPDVAPSLPDGSAGETSDRPQDAPPDAQPGDGGGDRPRSDDAEAGYAQLLGDAGSDLGNEGEVGTEAREDGGDAGLAEAPDAAATVPDPPENVMASSGDGHATVRWQAPRSDGGLALRSYTVTSEPDGVTVTVAATETMAMVGGLSNGTAYTFTVRASNDLGLGSPSGPSNQVTPQKAASAPAAPTGVKATASAPRTLLVSWAAPDDHGSPITMYVVIDADGGAMRATVPGSALTATVGSLDVGTSYSFRVRAVNGVGMSPLSEASPPIGAADVPGAPGNPTAKSQPGSKAVVSWTTSDARLSPLIRYVVTATPGGISTIATADATSATIANLALGTKYSFEIVAENALGKSAPAKTAEILAGDVPGAPSALVATPRKGGLIDLKWTAPSDNGSPISAYTVSSTPAGTPVSTSDTSVTLMGLALGSPYSFTVTAANGFGAGAAGNTPTSTVVGDVPGVPSNVTAMAVAADKAIVSWNVPLANGYAITSYTVRAVATSIEVKVGAGASSATVTGLQPGQRYSFSVTATNMLGEGPAGTTGDVGTPNVPDAPTAVKASVSAPRTLLVSWAAPDERGSAITSYVVTDADTGTTMATVGGSVTSASVADLQVGASYSFRVRAVNAIGPSALSAASPRVAAADVPAAPGNAMAGAQPGGKAQVSWTTPDARSSPLLRYVITGLPGGVMTVATAEETSKIIAGLTFGTRYSFELVAENALGKSAPAKTAEILAGDIPGAPSGLTATARKGGVVDLVWTAAADNGNPISTYTVTPSPSGASRSTSGTSIVITGLTIGSAYNFTVTAANALGTGSGRTTTMQTVVGDVPGAPGGVTAAAASGDNALVSWSAPLANGYPIRSYVVRAVSTPFQVTVLAPASSATINGLTPGQRYSFSVTASNDLGEGSAGTTPSTVPIGDAPSAPRNVTASPKTGGSIDVAWTAPASTGGFPVTGYTVTVSPGGRTIPTSGTATNVSGLSIGTSYSFSIVATNEIGTGPAGTTPSSTTSGDVPSAPGNVSAMAQPQRKALVSWTAPAANGYTISGYTVRSPSLASPVSVAAGQTSTTISGLVVGQPYQFTVTATNFLGESAAGGPSAPITPTCTASSKTLVATDSVSINYGSGTLSADNGVLAYHDTSSFPTFDSVGWVKFDLSTLPKTARITGITFNLLAEVVNGGDADPSVCSSSDCRPQLQIIYSSSDGWSRVTNPGPTTIPKTQAVSGITASPAGPPAFQAFTVNIAARDFDADLADGKLTLGITNKNSNFSYNQYYGSDATPVPGRRPFVDVAYCD